MRGRFLTLRMKLLGWLQRQCEHPPELVTYDLTEGGAETVSWCRVCGAVKLGWSKFEHEPRADWWIAEAKWAAAHDHCEICDGTRGGVPGNENIIESCGEKVVMCDYCSADEMRLPGFWKEGPRMGESAND